MRAAIRTIVAGALAFALLTAIGAPRADAAAPSSPWTHIVVGGFSTPTGGGGWLAYADGAVTAFGDARVLPDASNVALAAPIVGGTATPTGRGYWLVAADGGIFTYGDAKFFGSMGGTKLNQPVFSMASTRTGRGYWLVAYDGGIFTFGDARFRGALGHMKLNQPIVGITTTKSGNGYRMAARDGGVFNFGDAGFYGSAASSVASTSPVVGMAPTPTSRGYWVARRDGTVLAFGDAHDLGGVAATPWNPVSAVFANPTRQGYSVVFANGAVKPFGVAPGMIGRGPVLVPGPDFGTTLPADYVAPKAATRINAVKYGPRADQRLDVLLPDQHRFRGQRPVVLWLHSGGWVAGDRRAIPEMVKRQVSRGYVLVSADYGLAPTHRFPVPLQDVKLAIRFLKVNAARFSIDGSKIVVSGGSAGGHLAAMAGATAGTFEPTELSPALAKVTSKVAGVVDFVGPTDIVAFSRTPRPWAHGFTAALLGCTNPGYPKKLVCAPHAMRDASVAPYLDASDPPAYLAYGVLDDLVVASSQGAPLATAWANALGAGTSRVWYDLAQSGHNLGPDTINLRLLELFLDEAVAGGLR